MTFDIGALLVILQLVYLEGILSIDNAAVLGAMVAHLPEREPIPWPRLLRFLAQPVHRLLGGQRLAALKVGLLGAYVGRGSMLFIAAWVVRNRWLLFLGGAYLVYLALSHFGAEAEAAEAHERGHLAETAGAGFWAVVLNVELADLAFSLDNVVAAVALSREMWVVLTGVFLGIVTMRFAAGIFVRLIRREPILEAAAYLLVLAIGLQLMVELLAHVHISHAQKFAISLSVLGLSVVYARVPALQAAGRRMRWVGRLLAAVMAGLRLALAPLAWLLRQGLRPATAAVQALSVRRAAALPPSLADPPSGRDGGV